MSSPERQCEAFTKGSRLHPSHRCQREARHFHETPGDAVHLCAMHYEAITRRTRQGSDEELVRRWRSQS